MSISSVSPVSRLKDCPCAGRNLDTFIQPAVLAVLSEGPLHGYSILRRLGEVPMFHARVPDAAGVYRLLRAMQVRGLLASVWDVPGKGPAKRLFEMTPAGLDCLALWASTLGDYHRRIGQMVRMLQRRSTGRHALTARRQGMSASQCLTGTCLAPKQSGHGTRRTKKV
jgi:PadR family transcriptional regulator PadR